MGRLDFQGFQLLNVFEEGTVPFFTWCRVLPGGNLSQRWIHRQWPELAAAVCSHPLVQTDNSLEIHGLLIGLSDSHPHFPFIHFYILPPLLLAHAIGRSFLATIIQCPKVSHRSQESSKEKQVDSVFSRPPKFSCWESFLRHTLL